MKNIVFIAPPAAGKGTISQLLHEKYGIVNISVGQLLRDVDPESEMGKKIRKTQGEGQLVDNTITGVFLRQRLQKDDVKNGFLLDGFPREMAQVELLEEICEGLEINIDVAIYLSIGYDEALKRTLGRQICPDCKMTYNKLTGFSKPKVEDTCDYCKVRLTTRNDDNEESFKTRFKLFNEKTYPILEYYKTKGILLELDATESVDEQLEIIGKYLGED